MHVQMDAPVSGRMLEFMLGIMLEVMLELMLRIVLEILLERVQGHGEDTAKTNSCCPKLFHLNKSRMSLRGHKSQEKSCQRLALRIVADN